MRSKELKRERRKIDKTRRRHSHARVGAAALAAGAALAGGTQAYAAIVTFSNPAGPGHFDWVPATTPGHTTFGMLDIRLPSDAQPNLTTGASVFQQSFAPPDVGWSSVRNVPGVPSGFDGVEIGGVGDYFAISHSAGTLIPSGAPWGNEPFIFYPGYPAEIPLGTQTYLGVRFALVDGTHYGWIGVVRGVADPRALDAFAWGYETTPGVPIAAGVPEPGTLALLAFGAVGVVARRRRAEQHA